MIRHGPASRRPAVVAALVLAAGALRLTACGAPLAVTDLAADDGLRWYKGNTHTHTTESDGDSPPDTVAAWYRDHGYHFLVLSDHNRLTSVGALNALYGRDEGFLLIRGEEVSDVFAGKPVHINGLAVDSLVAPQGGATVVELLQRNVDAIRAAHGVPHINHPNYFAAVSPEDLMQVRRTRLFEVYNGHHLVANEGGNGVLPLEEAWDRILSAGLTVYGIAVDDAHHFKEPERTTKAGPGRGWVVVRARRLTADSVLAALERGDFYATTGPELSGLRITRDEYVVAVVPAAGRTERIQFIGDSGKVLLDVPGPFGRYAIRGTEGYVRARIVGSDGKKAWTQPVRPVSPR